LIKSIIRASINTFQGRRVTPGLLKDAAGLFTGLHKDFPNLHKFIHPDRMRAADF
jgi:hypothetical protein